MTAEIQSDATRLPGKMFVRGITLALACGAAQIAIVVGLVLAGLGEVARFATPVMLALAHGFFIVALADWGMRRVSGDTDDSTLPPLDVGIAGALGIGLPALAILFLMIGGLPAIAPYSLYWLDDFPWGLAGWTMLAITALPARIAAAVRGRPLAFKPVWQRLPLLTLVAVPVWALGYVFSGAPAGMMEGGMVVMPLVMLHTFAASTLAATLSVSAVRS